MIMLNVTDEITIGLNSEGEYYDRSDSNSDSVWFSEVETERVFLDPKEHKLRKAVIIVQLAAKINCLLSSHYFYVANTTAA